MTTSLHELARTIDAAIERAPLGDPVAISRNDHSVPGKPPRGLPPARPSFYWRSLLDTPTRRDPDGRERVVVDYSRDTQIQATLEADGTIAVWILCRLCRVDADREGFSRALVDAVEAATGQATFVVRDDFLFTRADLVDVRAVVTDGAAITADEVLAALQDALALSAGPLAESLAGRFGG